ncbi:MAG TPA: hypothetical protein VF167_03525 [Longimicrobiaceae bacterium]
MSTPLYLGIDLLAGSRYEGYSFLDQAVSELSAIDAPTRGLWLALGPLYQLLVLLFGVGAQLAAGRDRRLRIAASGPPRPPRSV